MRGGCHSRKISCWRGSRWREVRQKRHHGSQQLWGGSLIANHMVQLLAELCNGWGLSASSRCGLTGGWSSSTGRGERRGRGVSPRHAERRGRSDGCGSRLGRERRLLLWAGVDTRRWRNSCRCLALCRRMAIQALSFRPLGFGWRPVERGTEHALCRRRTGKREASRWREG